MGISWLDLVLSYGRASRQEFRTYNLEAFRKCKVWSILSSISDERIEDILFVGDHREKQLYEDLLAYGRPAILLITDVPSSGKSTLLLQFAQ